MIIVASAFDKWKDNAKDDPDGDEEDASPEVQTEKLGLVHEMLGCCGVYLILLFRNCKNFD